MYFHVCIVDKENPFKNVMVKIMYFYPIRSRTYWNITVLRHLCRLGGGAVDLS
jgi:hypothetical protein